jgi:hypothetical protein
MFADDQVIFAKSESDLQISTQLFYNITLEYNLDPAKNPKQWPLNVCTQEGPK